MTVFVSNTTLADNLDTWRLNTNHAATTLSNNVITVSNSGAPRGGYTAGNGHVQGTLSVSNLKASELSGGNTSVNSGLDITSNTNVLGTNLLIDANTTFTGNVDMTTITGTNRLSLPDASRIRMTGGTTGQYIKMNGDQFTFSFIQFSDFDELQSNSLPLILSGSNQDYVFEGFSNTTPPIQFETGTGDTTFLYLEDTNIFEKTNFVLKLADSGGLSEYNIRNSANANLHTFKTDGSVHFNQNRGAVPFVVEGETKTLMTIDGNAEDILFNGLVTANGGIIVNGDSQLTGAFNIDQLDIGANLVIGSSNENAHLIVNGNDLNSGGNNYVFPANVAIVGQVNGNTIFDSGIVVGLDADISGSVNIGGDVDIVGESTIGQALTVGHTLDVTGNTAISANLDVSGNQSIGGDASITGSLQVDGNADIDGSVVIGSGSSKTIHLNGTTTITSSFIPTADDNYDLGSPTNEWQNLYIDGRAEIDELSLGTLTGQGVSTNMVPKTGSQFNLGSSGRSWAIAYVDNVTVNKNLTVAEDITAEDISANSITTTSDVIFLANVEVGVDLNVSGNSHLNGDITLGTSTSTITSVGSFANAHIDSLTVTDETVYGRLDIEGTVGGFTSDGPVVLQGNTSIGGRFNITSSSPSAFINANTTVNAHMTVIQQFEVKDRIIARDDLISQAVLIANETQIGNTTIDGTLSVSNVVTFTANTTFEDNIYVQGDILVDGDITVGGRIQLGNDDTDIITTEGKFANAYMIDTTIENLTVSGSVVDDIEFDENVKLNKTIGFGTSGHFTDQQTKGIAQFNRFIATDDETKLIGLQNPQYHAQFHSNTIFSANVVVSGNMRITGRTEIFGELELPSNVVVSQANGVFRQSLISRGDTTIGQTTANTLWIYSGVATNIVPKNQTVSLGYLTQDQYWNKVYANTLHLSSGVEYHNFDDPEKTIISSTGKLHSNNIIENNSISYSKIENILDSFDAVEYGSTSEIPVFTVNRQGAITAIDEVTVNAVSSFVYSGDGFVLTTKDGTEYNAPFTANSIVHSVIKTMETVTPNDYGSATAIPQITVDRAGFISGITTVTPATVNNLEYNATLDRLRINTHDGATKDVTISRASTSQRGVASFESTQFEVDAAGEVTLADSSTGAVLGIQDTYQETEVTRNDGVVIIGLPDTVRIRHDLQVDNDISVGGSVRVSGNTVIDGNLIVSGNTVTIDATELSVEDPFITIASGQSIPGLNAGITVNRGFDDPVHLRWNEVTDRWQFTNDGTTYGNLLFASDVPDTTYTTSFSGISGASGANFNVTQFIDGVFDENTAMRFEEGNNIEITVSNTSAISISSVDTITSIGDGLTSAFGNITIIGSGGTSTNFDTLTKTLEVSTDLDDFFNSASFNASLDVLTLERGATNVQLNLGSLNNNLDEVLSLGNVSENPILAGVYGTHNSTSDLKLTRNEDNEIIFNASGTEYGFNVAGLDRDFKISSDGKEHMLFIDAGLNRIGIGKPNPSTDLDVSGTVKADFLRGQINYSQITDSPPDFSNLTIRDQDESTIIITGNTIWNFVGSNGLESVVTAPGGEEKTLTFQADSTGSMRIGSLGVGTTATGILGEIRATNDITAFSGSDRNLKENIVPIENALEKVKKINGVTYDWKDDYIEKRGGEDGVYVRKNDVGVIAQEIEEILPQIVTEREDGTKAVKYERIVALLIEAVKDLSAEIDELKKNK